MALDKQTRQRQKDHATTSQVEADSTMKMKTPFGKSKGIISSEALHRASVEELIDIMFEITLELRSRSTKPTNKISPTIEALSFPEIKDATATKFVRLPAAMTGDKKNKVGEAQRLILISSNPNHDLIGIEAHDDVVLGRKTDETQPDLDLTQYGGEEMGISRQHAMIRPDKDGLYLMDLGSTNGTFCNGERVKLGSPKKLKDKDTISLAGLHLKLQIVKLPV